MKTNPETLVNKWINYPSYLMKSPRKNRKPFPHDAVYDLDFIRYSILFGASMIEGMVLGKLAEYLTGNSDNILPCMYANMGARVLQALLYEHKTRSE